MSFELVLFLVYWILQVIAHAWIVLITIVSSRLMFNNLKSFINGVCIAIKRYKLKDSEYISFSDWRRILRAAYRHMTHNGMRDFSRAIDFTFLYPSRWRAAYNRLLNRKNK